MVRFALLALAVTATGCSEEPKSLLVDVRTDFVPGEEFTQVRVDVVGDPAASMRVPVSLDDDYLSGVRTAELELEAGTVAIDVTLLDVAESVVATRRTVVALGDDLGIIVIVTRSCREIDCSEPGTTCFNASCVNDSCRPGAPESCPAPMCTTDADCPARDACSNGVCDDGACLYEPIADACAPTEYCDPDTGCLRRSSAPPDAAMGTCVSGSAVTPVAVTVPSVWEPANTCNPDNVLELDGEVVGLDLLRDDACRSMWPDINACGCVQLDLGAVYPIARIETTAGPVGDACGRSCTSGFCGTGQTMAVSWGVEPEDVWLEHAVVRFESSALAQYAIPVGESARYVIACRVEWGAERDDVAIDVLSAICE